MTEPTIAEAPSPRLLGSRGRVWLLNPYGPIPGEGWRAYRFTYLAEALAERGWDVTWWTATFAHHFKRQRAGGWEDQHVAPGFTVRLVPTPSYGANVGVARLRFEAVYAAAVRRRATHEPPPDAVVGVDPPHVVGSVAAGIARRARAALVLDTLDLWPELFYRVVPAAVRPMAPLAFAPLRWWRAANLRRADLRVTVAESYSEVVRRAVGTRGRGDGAVETVYIGVDRSHAVDVPAERDAHRRAWGAGPDDLVAVYAGSLGVHYDVATLLDAARRLRAEAAPVRIVVAGAGPLAGAVAQACASEPALPVAYLGPVAPDALWPIYAAADVGLATYQDGSTVALPVKAFDYFAAGLPVVNSLSGDLARLLRARDAGTPYRAGDAADLARVLERLARSPADRARMAANARALGHEFDARAQHRCYADLVTVLARPTDAPGTRAARATPYTLDVP